MYKIFQENKALVFPKIDGDTLNFDATPQESDRYDADLLCNFLPEWINDRDPGDTIIHEISENAVALALNETFRMAPAAGGIIMKDGKFVSIVRKGIPDLPKGHIEKGETPEAAALREVEEETGIGNLKIVKALPITWHCYVEHEEWTLKPTYWYLMSTSENIQPKPQTEEGITEIKLTGNEAIEDFLRNTYRSTSEILGKELRQIVTK
jgi:hypothetical protein